MEDFTKRVVRIIQTIPSGKVMSYGQIAKLAGSPRAARQVVRTLHTQSKKESLPWHRVINSKGEIAIQQEEGRFTQKELLEEEGIPVEPGGKISLKHHQHFP